MLVQTSEYTYIDLDGAVKQARVLQARADGI